MKHTAIHALFAAAALLTSVAAQSAVVTQWSVGVNAVFDTNTVAWDTSNGSTGARNIAPLSLSWGESTGQGLSGLSIGSTPIATTVNTNGPAVNNITVTHTNFPITGVTLDSVTLLSTLTLTPLVPALPGLPAVTQPFKIDFKETPNGANPCANGEPNNTGININGCADIFVIDYASLNFPFSYDTDGPGGDAPVLYYISFFEASNKLQPLPAAACGAAGVGAPCLGFMTAENTRTTAQFAALITTHPVSVPEPGTLALLGIALTGLGLARRRRNI